MTTEQILKSNGTIAIETTPFWSVLAHIVVALPVLLCQSLLKRSAYFRPINEFLCSFLWTAWSLECVVIGSSTLAPFILFLRLLVPRYAFRGAYTNPCSALFECMEKGLRRQRHFKNLFSSIAIEVIATFFAIIYCYVMWNVLGSTISEDHRQFLGAKPEYFLQVSLLPGFLMELFLTFVAWIPKLVMKDSLHMVLVQASLTTCLVVQFSGSTGAFMNPVTALSFVLAWHRLGATARLLEHFIVYWGGPLVGTALAVAMAQYHKRNHMD